MQENIAWFDYWLLGERDPNSPYADRYTVWDKMRDEAPRHCGTPLPLQNKAGSVLPYSYQRNQATAAAEATRRMFRPSSLMISDRHCRPHSGSTKPPADNLSAHL